MSAFINFCWSRYMISENPLDLAVTVRGCPEKKLISPKTLPAVRSLM